MDINFTPDPSSWEIILDSAPIAIDSQVWFSATRLDITLVAGPAPIVDLTIELLEQDPALHSDHLIPVLPFGPDVVPEV